MKKIAAIDQQIGNTDGKVQAAIGVEASNLKLELSATYPIEKIVEPATTALDGALDKLEKAIPGDWDKPLIEKIKAEYKAELIKLLSE